MLFGLFITLGVAVLSIALRSYQSSISQKVGAFGILTTSFLAIYYLTGNWVLGLLSALSWLFLPWLEILPASALFVCRARKRFAQKPALARCFPHPRRDHHPDRKRRVPARDRRRLGLGGLPAILSPLLQG
jgi:hypothetical protein